MSIIHLLYIHTVYIVLVFEVKMGILHLKNTERENVNWGYS